MVEKNKYFWQIISQYVDRLKKGSKVDSIVQSFYNQYLYLQVSSTFNDVPFCSSSKT